MKRRDKIFSMVCVVAMAQNRVIGDGRGLLWHLPNDLKRVKQLTMGCPLIMGRKTYQSIGKPLAGRANIVITRNLDFQAEGAVMVSSLDAGIRQACAWLTEQDTDENRLILFGGGQIYAEGLKYCSVIEATILADEFAGEAVFPDLDASDWKQERLESFPATADYPAFSYYKFTRRSAPETLPY